MREEELEEQRVQRLSLLHKCLQSAGSAAPAPFSYLFTAAAFCVGSALNASVNRQNVRCLSERLELLLPVAKDLEAAPKQVVPEAGVRQLIEFLTKKVEPFLQQFVPPPDDAGICKRLAGVIRRCQDKNDDFAKLHSELTQRLGDLQFLLVGRFACENVKGKAPTEEVLRGLADNFLREVQGLTTSMMISFSRLEEADRAQADSIRSVVVEARNISDEISALHDQVASGFGDMRRDQSDLRNELSQMRREQIEHYLKQEETMMLLTRKIESLNRQPSAGAKKFLGGQSQSAEADEEDGGRSMKTAQVVPLTRIVVISGSEEVFSNGTFSVRGAKFSDEPVCFVQFKDVNSDVAAIQCDIATAERYFHQNILSYRAVVRGESDGACGLVTEKFSHVLSGFLGKLKKDALTPTQHIAGVVTLMGGLGAALSKLHDMHCTHGNIHVTTVMVECEHTDPTHWSALLDAYRPHTKSSWFPQRLREHDDYKAFQPPEATKVDSAKHQKAADTYALGVVLFALLATPDLAMLREPLCPPQAMQYITSACPNVLRVLCERCLRSSPSERPSLFGINKVLARLVALVRRDSYNDPVTLGDGMDLTCLDPSKQDDFEEEKKGVHSRHYVDEKDAAEEASTEASTGVDPEAEIEAEIKQSIATGQFPAVVSQRCQGLKNRDSVVPLCNALRKLFEAGGIDEIHAARSQLQAHPQALDDVITLLVKASNEAGRRSLCNAIAYICENDTTAHKAFATISVRERLTSILRSTRLSTKWAAANAMISIVTNNFEGMRIFGDSEELMNEVVKMGKSNSSQCLEAAVRLIAELTTQPFNVQRYLNDDVEQILIQASSSSTGAETAAQGSAAQTFSQLLRNTQFFPEGSERFHSEAAVQSILFLAQELDSDSSTSHLASAITGMTVIGSPHVASAPVRDVLIHSAMVAEPGAPARANCLEALSCILERHNEARSLFTTNNMQEMLELCTVCPYSNCTCNYPEDHRFASCLICNLENLDLIEKYALFLATHTLVTVSVGTQERICSTLRKHVLVRGGKLRARLRKPVCEFYTNHLDRFCALAVNSSSSSVTKFGVDVVLSIVAQDIPLTEKFIKGGIIFSEKFSHLDAFHGSDMVAALLEGRRVRTSQDDLDTLIAHLCDQCTRSFRHLSFLVQLSEDPREIKGIPKRLYERITLLCQHDIDAASAQPEAVATFFENIIDDSTTSLSTLAFLTLIAKDVELWSKAAATQEDRKYRLIYLHAIFLSLFFIHSENAAQALLQLTALATQTTESILLAEVIRLLIFADYTSSKVIEVLLDAFYKPPTLLERAGSPTLVTMLTTKDMIAAMMKCGAGSTKLRPRVLEALAGVVKTAYSRPQHEWPTPELVEYAVAHYALSRTSACTIIELSCAKSKDCAARFQAVGLQWIGIFLKSDAEADRQAAIRILCAVGKQTRFVPSASQLSLNNRAANSAARGGQAPEGAPDFFCIRVIISDTPDVDPVDSETSSVMGDTDENERALLSNVFNQSFALDASFDANALPTVEGQDIAKAVPQLVDWILAQPTRTTELIQLFWLFALRRFRPLVRSDVVKLLSEAMLAGDSMGNPRMLVIFLRLISEIYEQRQQDAKKTLLEKACDALGSVLLQVVSRETSSVYEESAWRAIKAVLHVDANCALFGSVQFYSALLALSKLYDPFEPDTFLFGSVAFSLCANETTRPQFCTDEIKAALALSPADALGVHDAVPIPMALHQQELQVVRPWGPACQARRPRCLP